MTKARHEVLAAVALAVLALSCRREATGAETGDRKVLYYKSPMDPSFVSLKPGKDAMGMALVPVHEGDPGADLQTIVVNGATVQRMGVRLSRIGRARLERVVRALGKLEFDETRVANVNMKFDGWIERLYVNETGQFVKRGAPLFAVYSPELVASQEEYVQLLRGAGEGPHAQHLVEAARSRLLQFDVPRGLVEEIGRTGKAQRLVTVRAPADGFVVQKTAFEGTFVKRGATLFTLADLGALWVMAEVYEFDAPWVAPGQEATVELDYLPGQMQEARVDYVYPTLDEKTRTLAVRVVLPNPKVTLKPGMLATVRIHARPVGEAVVVPTEAVLHSGERNVVFVARGDGRFEPRDVKLGVAGEDAYQVLAGLAEGEDVVVSGQFLLDSESRLKEAVLKMLGSNVAPQPAGAAGASGHGAMPGMEPPSSGEAPKGDGAERKQGGGEHARPRH